ncbi:MAG: tRNA lysidine(34) synthetase TilS [Flavobacteriaceae bacterium]|nr:tRNA lysidine(34) synthetase TilS [Flavobacteriaceae bacterium]
MLIKLQSHLKSHFPFLDKSKLLIAISGGLDSVVLTHLCHKLELDFALAHCNFNLRGTESDADEQFVIQLANDLNIEVFIESFKTEAYAKQQKLSTQMAARELRYHWFYELVEQLGFDYILTAHHTDDNLETFLINLSRGTGLEGLSGIPEINENVVRPLLPFSREDIQQYAKVNKLKWREDSSNISTKYLRNKLRLEVIPKLKEVNPQLLKNFNKTIEHIQDSKDIIDDRIDAISNQVIKDVNTNCISFNISEIKKLSNTRAYVYELLKDFGFTEWNDVNNLLVAQSGKQVFSKTHRLLKDRDCLLLSVIDSNVILNITEKQNIFCYEGNSEAVKNLIIIAETDKHIQTPLGTLFFDEADAILGKRIEVIFVDKALLKFPLTVRQWQEGDYFYPFGMQGKKKLSKFFKDEKLSLLDKENIWVLCSDNEVVWIINRRADDRFKVTESTKRILKIELQ